MTAYVWHRPAKPFGLGLLISLGVVAWADLVREDVQDWHTARDVLGAWALAAMVLLTLGWTARQHAAYEWGLCVAAGAWTARALLALTGHTLLGVGWTTGLLSAAWAIGAGGAYLLERADRGSDEFGTDVA